MSAVDNVVSTACLRMLRVSARKLNLLAKAIRGKRPQEAVALLSFSQKRVAVDVKKLLLSAIANAENKGDYDVAQLRIAQATVGRSFSLRRTDLRGRSRMGRIIKEFSQIRVVLSHDNQLPE